MIIGRLEITIYTDSKTAWICKHYNDSVHDTIRLDEDDIYNLEFAIKTIKRHLELDDQ